MANIREMVIRLASIESKFKEKKHREVKKTLKKMIIHPSLCNMIHEYNKTAIREKIHKMFYKQKQPTLDVFLKSVNTDKNLPYFTQSALYHLMRNLHFKFTKNQEGDSVILENSKIALWRRKYLRKIRKGREQNRKIYYLKETWINLDNFEKFKNFDFKSTGKRKLTMQTNALLLLLNVCSDTEVLYPSYLSIELCKSSSYIPEVSSPIFIKWFECLLPRLENNCIIVMENKPNYRVQLEYAPNNLSCRIEIINWLRENNVLICEDMIKSELLKMVKKNKLCCKKYLVENLAKQQHKQVLWIPPNHNELNLMEILWPRVYKLLKLNSPKISNAHSLYIKSINMLTKKDWISILKQVTQKELYFWNLDDIIDEVIGDYSLYCIKEEMFSSDNTDSE